MTVSLESQLRAKLTPLLDDKGFLRGAILMAYACKGNGEPQRAESFAADIVLTIISNVLQLSADFEGIVLSEAGVDAIGTVTSASFELAQEGLLIESSVYGDACPYLQLPSPQNTTK